LNTTTSASSILPIVLTDGYADLNLDYDRSNPLLRVISPGGLDNGAFDYGDVVRIEL
jgi:predicted metal-dependent peptidase